VVKAGVAGPVTALRQQLTHAIRHRYTSIYHLSHALFAHAFTAPAFPRGGVDGRISAILTIRALCIVDVLLLLYPRLFAADGPMEVLPLSGASFSMGSCFVLHTVDEVFVWVADSASQEYVTAAFGDDVNYVPRLETRENQRLNKIIEGCWALSGRYLTVTVMRQGDPREAVFAEVLVDDAIAGGMRLADWIKQFR
jgi:hypothetical protein